MAKELAKVTVKDANGDKIQPANIAMDGEVELYPVNDEGRYNGELQKVYHKLQLFIIFIHFE